MHECRWQGVSPLRHGVPLPGTPRPRARELPLAICKLQQTIACTSAGGKGCLPLDTGCLARASRVQGELALATCKLRQTIACTSLGGKGCLPLDTGCPSRPVTWRGIPAAMTDSEREEGGDSHRPLSNARRPGMIPALRTD